MLAFSQDRVGVALKFKCFTVDQNTTNPNTETILRFVWKQDILRHSVLHVHLTVHIINYIFFGSNIEIIHIPPTPVCLSKWPYVCQFEQVSKTWNLNDFL